MLDDHAKEGVRTYTFSRRPSITRQTIIIPNDHGNRSDGSRCILRTSATPMLEILTSKIMAPHIEYRLL